MRALEEKENRRSNNPLKYIKQHDKQKEATNALEKLNKSIIALFWGNRVGKTEWGAQTVSKIVLGEHPIIKTPAEIWSACPSYDEQKDTTQEKLLSYIPDNRITDRIWLRKGILKEIEIDGKSRITFKSYEQGRGKFQGAGKHLIWFDEEPPKDIWEECFVRQKAGVIMRVILTMTPVLGMTWVYNDLYLNTDNPDLYVSNAGWKHNPYLLSEQIAVMSRGLSETALRVRRDGEFVKMTGLVCNWFNRDTHLVDIKELPEGETFLGLDFGFTDPTAGLYIRVDREFNFWIFDGFYRRNLTNPDIQQILKLKEQGLGRIRRIGDSAQASDIKQLCNAGFSVEGVKKESGTSRENWDEYRARLMEERGRVQELTGKPKIFIANSLKDLDAKADSYNFLLKEIENLRWEEIKTEMGIEQRPRWGKQPKHAIDALSYVIATILQVPRERKRNKYKPISNSLTGY